MLTEAAAPTGIAEPGLLKDRAYVAGVWVESAEGKRIPVTDPATGEACGEVAALTAAQSVAAVEEAHRAPPR